MKLQVENLGAIKKGEIDLWKNLIVLTGKNNVGKSYLSYLIYGFFKMSEYKAREIENNSLVNRYKELLDWELSNEGWIDSYWNEYGFSIPFAKFLEGNYEKLYTMLLDLSIKR
jgi:predicted ATPase